MSSLQWTLLAVGLPCVLLGAGSMRWADAFEDHVETRPFGAWGTGLCFCVFGLLLLIGVAAPALGAFTACVLRSAEGVGVLLGNVFWVVIASVALVGGLKERDSGQVVVGGVMLSIAAAIGFLAYFFHSAHVFVDPVVDLCGCF